MPEEISISTASKVANVSEQAVRDWCNKGLVQHRRVGLRRLYIVDREDLVRLATELGYIVPQQPEK